MLLTSCKEPDLLGLSDLENNNLIAYFSDTATINAITLLNDSARTDESNFNMVGRYVDPFFGSTQASFYTQLMPIKTYKFPSEAKVDSVLFTIAYADYISYKSIEDTSVFSEVNYYGDITKNLTLNIHELNEDLQYTSSYFSYSSTSVNSLDLCNQLSFKPKSNDTIIKEDLLRIKLDNSIGEKIVNLHDTILEKVGYFVDAFKGLKVSVDASTDASILFFNLVSPNTKMTIYYNDSLSSEFIINGSCARYNQIQHQYATTAHPFLVKQVVNIDTTNSDSLLFLQSGGTKIKVNIPYLTEFRTGGITVSKAEIVLPVESSYNNTYFPPIKGIKIINSNGKSLNNPDTYVYYNEDTKDYRINISEYVQGLITGLYPNHSFYIQPFDNSINFNKCVIKNSNCTKGLRLELTMVNNKP